MGTVGLNEKIPFDWLISEFSKIGDVKMMVVIYLQKIG